MSNSTLYSVNLNDLTKAEERALVLLGQGVIPEQVAAASGLSASRISQLLSQEHFAARVAELRFEALAKHNDRDAAYDALEDELIERMKDCLPLMVRPHEILKAIQVINQAKRRGSSAPNSITEQSTVIQLILPTQVLTQFSLNQANQVVSVQGAVSQDLLTIQSGSLLNMTKKKLENQNVLSRSAKVLNGAVSAEDF